MTEKSSIFNATDLLKERGYGAFSATAKKKTIPSMQYKIQPNDSILSIAIRYNTTVEELKRMNSLWTNDIFHLSELKVPMPSSSSSDSPDVLPPNYEEACQSPAYKDPTTLTAQEYLNQVDSRMAVVKQKVQEIDANGSWRNESIFNGRNELATSSSSPALDVKVVKPSNSASSSSAGHQLPLRTNATVVANAVTKRLHDQFYEL